MSKHITGEGYALLVRLRHPDFGGGALELDAADEIERLRAEAREFERVCATELRGAHAEIERLRAEIEELRRLLGYADYI